MIPICLTVYRCKDTSHGNCQNEIKSHPCYDRCIHGAHAFTHANSNTQVY